MSDRHEEDWRRNAYRSTWDYERSESVRSAFFWYCVRAAALVGVAVAAAFGSLEWCVVGLLAVAITVERTIDAVARRVVALEDYVERCDEQ